MAGLSGSLRFVPAAPAGGAAAAAMSLAVAADGLSQQVGGRTGPTLAAPDQSAEQPLDESVLFLLTEVVPPPVPLTDTAPLITGIDEAPAGSVDELHV